MHTNNAIATATLRTKACASARQALELAGWQTTGPTSVHPYRRPLIAPGEGMGDVLPGDEASLARRSIGLEARCGDTWVIVDASMPAPPRVLAWTGRPSDAIVAIGLIGAFMPLRTPRHLLRVDQDAAAVRRWIAATIDLMAEVDAESSGWEAATVRGYLESVSDAAIVDTLRDTSRSDWGETADCDGDPVTPWRVHLHGAPAGE